VLTNKLQPNSTNISYASLLQVQQIGTSAEASVLVPIIWNLEDENQERFAVELQEDVSSTDKRIALSKGTILITEIHSVSKINKLVKQSVVAVVYKDSVGRVQQQTIPKNTILIRGENNKPLLAKSMSDKGKAIAQQDILIGLLGAAIKIREFIALARNTSDKSLIEVAQTTRVSLPLLTELGLLGIEDSLKKPLPKQPEAR
jgi:hypothetical protein